MGAISGPFNDRHANIYGVQLIWKGFEEGKKQSKSFKKNIHKLTDHSQMFMEFGEFSWILVQNFGANPSQFTVDASVPRRPSGSSIQVKMHSKAQGRARDMAALAVKKPGEIEIR